MGDELETWLLDAGDEIIRKESLSGAASLTPLEHAIYSLWVIDYAVRNSGTLDPMEELYPNALQELLTFSRSSNLPSLSVWLPSARNEQMFCNAYYNHFSAACAELQQLHVRA